MDQVAILVPMLGRAWRVRPLVASIEATTPTPHTVLFLLTLGDGAVLKEVTASGHPFLELPARDRGDYPHKINVGYHATTERLLFLAADDLLFHPGWLEAAVAELAPGIGVVGTNDLGSPRVRAGQHATHCLVTRAYADLHGTIDTPGLILHEGYWHEYCDDELVQTARHRGAWAFAQHSYVEHLHPNWGKAPMDPMYCRQRERMRAGRRTFLARRPLWT